MGTSRRLTELQPLALGADDSGGAQAPSLFVHPGSQDAKPFLGFGGSFTEASAVTLQRMTAKRREEVLKAYFDRKSGIAFTLGRVPIGSCDFGLGNWTCGDLAEGDAELRNFSIDRYREGILPLIRAAGEHAGSPLTILASPWSPPPWMKTKATFNGDGRLLAKYRGAWALHFVLFVQEMERAGVQIWGVSVQNEPEAAQSWESCLYTAEEERDFVKDFLGPALEKAGLGGVKILVWDHNRDGMLERAASIYDDPEAAKYVWGVAYHWYGDARFEAWPPRSTVCFEDRQRDGAPLVELRACAGFENVRQVAALRPDKHILFTEGCQELGGRPLSSVLGTWKLGERYAMNIIADLNSGCEGWIDWNLCLDETGGPNHVGNLCVAPVICDTRTDEVLYQPSFWYMAHFSRYVAPGARRVLRSSSRDALESTAFVNPDGSLVVVVMNQSDQALDFWFKVAGVHGMPTRAVRLRAPARSILTVCADDKEPPALLRWAEALLPAALRRGLASLAERMQPREPWQRVAGLGP